MKKIGIGLVAMCVAVMVMLASCFTAQKLDYVDKGIPEGKSLLTGVYNFATQKSKTWEVYDPVFVSINAIADNYVFTGSFLTKQQLLFSTFIDRYDFTCTVERSGNELNVTLSDTIRYSSDGSRLSKFGYDSGKYEKVPTETAAIYASQIKNEILSRMYSWSDESYGNILSTTLTSPEILDCIAGNSEIVFNKFVSDNKVVGRIATLDVIATKIEEATDNSGYKYKITGVTPAGYQNRNKVIIPNTVSVTLYTNNDNVFALTPVTLLETSDKNLSKAATYQAIGKIEKCTRIPNGVLMLDRGSVKLEICE